MTSLGLDPILFWGGLAASVALVGAFLGVAVIVRRLGQGDVWAVTTFAALLGAVFLINTGDAAPSQAIAIGRLACAAYAAYGLLRIAFARWPAGLNAKEAVSADR